MNKLNSVITLTFGDQAENHVGMEKIGKIIDIGQGFTLNDFKEISNKIKNVEIYNLSILGEIENKYSPIPEAYIIVIRQGVDTIFTDLKLEKNEYNSDKMFDEQSRLNVDKKAYMYGRVVNKNARWNLCFDEKNQEPNYENGKGRIVSFNDVPITKKLLDSFPKYFGDKANNLKGEGNYYYDIKKCGIGFHGDSERRKVLAVRLGTSLDIHFQWYIENKSIGKRIIIPLNGGDIYIMSEKAVGTDWKKKKILTLRHATGCFKYTLYNILDEENRITNIKRTVNLLIDEDIKLFKKYSNGKIDINKFTDKQIEKLSLYYLCETENKYRDLIFDSYKEELITNK